MRKLKQRLCGLLLCAAVLVSLCPTALAEDVSIPYLDETGTEKFCEKYKAVNKNELEWAGGWYVAENSVYITDRVTVTGDVHLILTNGCDLTAMTGIQVSEGNSLTIYAQSKDESDMGRLEAYGSQGEAGIGGVGYGDDGGNITINGGSVTAVGLDNGAGIGGGKITINGGTVKATSSYGAGIGGGAYGNGGTIAITGGTVTAASKDSGNAFGGAGIGGGYQGGGGSITISGGTVEAISESGVDIGGGYDSASGNIVPSGKIEISEGANVKGSGGGKPNVGPVHGAKTDEWASDGTNHWHPCKIESCAEQFGKEAHDFTEWTTDTEPTATTPGSRHRDCRICQYWQTGTIPPLHSHSYGQAWESNASGHWHECSCGDRSGYAAHTPGSAATCTKPQTCTTCGHVLESVSGHTPGPAATCTEPQTCTTCGHVLEAALGHTPGPAATCTEPQTCTVCGHVLEAALGHTPGPAATCTEPQVCTVCGHVLVAALGHSFGEKVPQKDATTTSTGMKAHYLCSRCGNYFDEDKNLTTADALTIPKKVSDGGSYTPPTYPPTVERPSEGGGAAAVSPSRPERSDTVTVTPRPNEGYQVDAITVTDKNGKPVEVTARPNGTYTFIQPASKVKIEVTYKPVERPWSNPFADVSEDDWYYEAVRYVQENSLINGYSDGRFGANDTLSRAQLAQILFNKEGKPGVNYLLDFSDVADEAWYTEAVRWAASQGIVGGYGNGTFGPNDPITREQLAVMLWRYSGNPAATSKELHFNDMDEISGFALEALRWAVENGILNGYGDGRLGPQGQVTRAQAAQMLKNFIEHQEEDF